MAANTSLVPRSLRPDPPETARLWPQFAQQRDNAECGLLIPAYIGFTRSTAAKVRRMEFFGYLQHATVALVEAVDCFVQQCGAVFESFASSHISGAILTGGESSSEIRRQIAARQGVVGERVSSLPDPAPVLNGTFLAQLAGLAVGFVWKRFGMHRQKEAAVAECTYSGVELKPLRGSVMAALVRLLRNPPRLIESQYLQHLQFKEVASAMKMMRRRFSQIHKEPVHTMRASLTSRSRSTCAADRRPATTQTTKEHTMTHPILSMLNQDELFQLARNASASGDSASTIAYLKEGVSRADATAVAHYLLGAEYAQVGLYECAAGEMESALALDPALAIARLQLGLLWLGAGAVERADSVLSPLAELATGDPLRHFGAGLCHLIRNHMDDAVLCFEQGIALNAVNAPLNGDMRKIIDGIAQASVRGGASPASASAVPSAAAAVPTSAEGAHHILLSAYTGSTTH